MTITERRLEILKWERDNRTSLNRAVSGIVATSCIYSGEIGCGVGRLIEDKDLCRELDRWNASGVCLNSVFDRLPDSVKELGQDFLTDVQNLHDTGVHWHENGLTDAGEMCMANLEAKWS